MKKKNKNKARKSITAVGAVVAAGLTPGFVTGTPAQQSPANDIELTAADVVSINGDVFDFDDLFAMHQVNRAQDRQKVVYGPPHPKVDDPAPPKDKDKDKDKKKKDKKKDKKKRQEEINDSIRQVNAMREQEEAQRQRELYEAWRQDSIRRARETHALVYGPPPDRFRKSETEIVRDAAAFSKEQTFSQILDQLVWFCKRDNLSDNGNSVLENGNITSNLKMDSAQQESLIQEIERSYGVQVTEEMLKQLGSLERIAKFIIEVITPIK